MKEIINASLERAAIKRGESSQPLRYLEIGVHKGETFQSVSSRIKEIEVIKEGVDPYGPFSHVHRMTSQVFFAINETFWKKKYDVIFNICPYSNSWFRNPLDYETWIFVMMHSGY